MNTDRIAEMTRRLSTLAASEINIQDQSHLHAGHPGANSGGGHFTLEIVSDQFEGMQPLQRQRAVYTALGNMMHKEIHALQIQALSPREVTARPESNSKTSPASTTA